METIRIGIIKEECVHRVAGIPKSVGDKLRAEGRAADADKQEMAELSRRGRDLAGVDLSGELFDPRIRVFDIVSQAGTRSQSRIAQPLVTNHTALIRVRDRTGFQL